MLISASDRFRRIAEPLGDNADKVYSCASGGAVAER
jgi:hypothetical protein